MRRDVNVVMLVSTFFNPYEDRSVHDDDSQNIAQRMFRSRVHHETILLYHRPHSRSSFLWQ